MKELYFILTVFIFLFGLNSCASDDVLHPLEDLPSAMLNLTHSSNEERDVKTEKRLGDSDIKIASDIQSTIEVSMKEMGWKDEVNSVTKTAWGNANNSVIWTTGDQIGVSMRYASNGAVPNNASNIQYNINAAGTNTSSIMPNSLPIYFPDRVTNMQFYAYYPYSASMNSLLLDYTLPADQSTQQALRSADLMRSSTPITNGLSPNINLNFSHQMVLLSFQIKTSLLPATLTKVTVSGLGVTNKGTLDLKTGTLTPSTTATFTPSVTTSQRVSPSTTAYVDIIINPCTISSNINSSQLKVTLSFSGLLDHSTNLVTSGTFVKGTRYVYNLSVVLSL